MIFSELNINTPLLNALSDIGYEYPTPIQKEAFSVILSGKDVVGIAQTGTGKTFAYLLPILKQHKYSEQRNPRILIVVPTRELVLQVVKEAKSLTEYMNIRIAGVYGGTNMNTQKQMVYDGLDLLVATPGRLIDLALTSVLRLKSIQKLVIDEVDEMLNLGFRRQLIDLLDMLPKKRQNLMFSATLSEGVEQLINDFFFEPKKIEIAAHGTPLKQIIQQAYHVPNFNTKVNLLEIILSDIETLNKVLVFVSNKKLADRLHEHLAEKFPDQLGVIHSNKSQNYRINSLKRFEDGTHRVLISTDIMARGLDITDVTHVINFDTPDVPGDYLHRIGRTGRADKTGVAITFINEAEQVYQMDIEKTMKKAIPMVEFPENLEISNIYTEEERPSLHDKNYLKAPSIKQSKGAFHEKKEKNIKVNSGSPARKRKHKKGKSAKGRRRV
ncbi:MAG: ATP-dependent helicase [Bacteroidetes bacterium]|nr:MAG: ATP-dependent helicase [Bacteroidota bacterium]